MVKVEKATRVSGDVNVIICIPHSSRAGIRSVTTQEPGAAGAGLLGAGVTGAPAESPLPGTEAVLAKAGAENFPVALRLLPRRYRQHLMAVYLFARTTDDIGDLAPVAERPGMLAALEADLQRLYAGLGSPDPAAAASGSQSPAGEPRLAAVRGLAGTITECGVPMALFGDLIRANQQDQVVSRYETFDDLLGYCRLSANPVGRIVLYVFGRFSGARAELSDSICTGLQLAEHWQDVAEDLRAGRIYLPMQDLRHYGCTERDLAAPHASPQVRRLIEFEVARTRELIDEGAPLISGLRGAARAAVAGYVAGGRAALAAIAAADYDVLAGPPRPGKCRTAAELANAFTRAR
jgi:squalene synthase HpnC